MSNKGWRSWISTLFALVMLTGVFFSVGSARADNTALTTSMWTVTYSEDWQYSEDKLTDRENRSAYVTMEIPGEQEGSALVSVYIEASVTDADKYRDRIRDGGMDAYDIVENGNGKYVKVGGVDCLYYEGKYRSQDCVHYFGRVEGAGVTVYVRVAGALDDERIQPLLDSLQFTLTDTGKTDPPWPWNGEPYATEDHDTLVGTVKLHSQQVKLDQSLIVNDIFSGRIAVAGNACYIQLDGALLRYDYDGNTLTYVETIPLDKTYEDLSACDDGIIYVADFGRKLTGISNGEIVSQYDGTKNVTMHPSGQWGISFFTGNEVSKFNLSNGTISSETLTLAEIKSISSVSISKNHMMIAGSSVETERQTIFIYDPDGTLLLTLGAKESGNPDSLGSVTNVIETDAGYIALDGNMRTILLWSPDGGFIGRLDDSELFGTRYPWMSAACLDANGDILFGMTEERADKSADEFIVFRITGFSGDGAGEAITPRNEWKEIDGVWYHYDENGTLSTGWLNDGEAWYWMDENGAMTTGWVLIGEDYYYLNDSGVMQTGWLQDGGFWYYLDSSGRMLKNEQMGEYTFDEEGHLIE